MLQSAAVKEVASNVLLNRISSVIELTEQDRAQIRKHINNRESRAKGSLIAEEGDPIRRFSFLVSGWALRQTYLADGRRQIFGFILPGDLLEPFAYLRVLAHEGLLAVTQVDLVDAEKMVGKSDRIAPQNSERLHNALAREHLQFTRNHLLRLGYQDAFQRVAHLLLELYDRLSTVGLTFDGSFSFPLTQEMLADALGLSIIHISRTLKQLRQANFIQFSHGRLRICQRVKLATLAEYVGINRDRRAAPLVPHATRRRIGLGSSHIGFLVDSNA